MSVFKHLMDLMLFTKRKNQQPKKIIKLLDAKPESASERECFEHLKRYIKNLSCSSINGTFTKMEGAARRPLVNTCAPALELPCTYQSFNELSEEFSSLLRERFLVLAIRVQMKYK